MSNRKRCSVTFRRRSGCRRIILCDRFARWWTGFERDVAAFGRLYAQVGGRRSRPSDCCRSAAADLLFHSQRASVDGAAQLQPAVPLVRGMEMDEAVWHHAVFSKNRERLLNEAIAEAFFQRSWRSRNPTCPMSTSRDGTLIEAWASHKSFRPRMSSRAAGRERRSEFSRGAPLNATHQSTTDPEARRYKSRKAARPSSATGSRADGKSPRVVGKTRVTLADGSAERDAALAMAGKVAAASASPWRRQELRHARLRARFAATADHAARSAKHHEPLQCD